MKKNDEISLEKLATMPKDSVFEVKIARTLKFARDEYLLYRIAKRAFEEKRAELDMRDMSFDEYVVRTFVFGVGASIVAGLESEKMGHA